MIRVFTRQIHNLPTYFSPYDELVEIIIENQMKELKNEINTYSKDEFDFYVTIDFLLYIGDRLAERHEAYLLLLYLNQK